MKSFTKECFEQLQSNTRPLRDCDERFKAHMLYAQGIGLDIQVSGLGESWWYAGKLRIDDPGICYRIAPYHEYTQEQVQATLTEYADALVALEGINDPKVQEAHTIVYNAMINMILKMK